MNAYPHPLGPDRRRGPFRAGERVQLTDTKGRKYTTMLTTDGYFQSARGNFRHSALIGADEGTVFEAETGHTLQAFRPLVADYVLSMPRGATPIYPKDSAQIIQQADVFPGARVFEAGVGSGGLTISLLAAIGPEGHLTSVERREEFAEIAQANVESWYGPQVPPWELFVGEAAQALDEIDRESLDHVLLDMLAPWELILPASRALRSGGVIVGYVTTTTQLSRFVEQLRESESYSEPVAFESVVRTWHLDGLAVRPNHSMVGHTGFLVLARRIARNSSPLIPKRRPAPAAHSEEPDWDWTEDDLPQHEISEKKLRKVRRDVAHRADVELSGRSLPGDNSERIRKKLDNETRQQNERRYAQRRIERDEGEL
ncbi:tRNA (adenine57-N1/adenine58-N1)-methyltransferase [Trueperella bonasi]|uniref:tRNA (Adenine57-N1/adenine58-N1)-methyltransferase n=1 Tax=Trueperella bonasi TaxID=312286 RepID=A0ABT9NDP8_9ACTO|nr:tRNA (adenine-N1)-methyltransferase [Trueperella bonasi]MDP9805520.1 tRNA (adenine57-N1/adenine58-N1)-methyltransferase [Trueperella bonasi]